MAILLNKQLHNVTVWIQRRCVFPFFFFFFLSHGGRRQILLFMRQMSLFTYCFGTVYILFMESTATLFKKNILKIGFTVLFTHLKIILLQCFQFLVFSFSNNKFNSNGSNIILKPKLCGSSVFSLIEYYLHLHLYNLLVFVFFLEDACPLKNES